MRPRALLPRVFLLLSLGFAFGTSLAGDDCDVPLSQWQSREAVRRMAAGQGWQVQRLKIDDGCYEIRGTDAQGRDFKAKVDPATLAILKIKHKDRKGDGARRPSPSTPAPATPPREPDRR